jgi:excisionase family DNA binding protein
MLTVKGAAARAGVSQALIYAWIAAGVLAHHRMGRPGSRGVIRIGETDLEAFLSKLRREGQVSKPPVPPRRKVVLRHLVLPS